MSGTDVNALFLFSLPPAVLWEFCRVMDGLSDLDWTRFASEVLCDQTSVRLAQRKERRTDWVMDQWENRNGRVGDLIDVLQRLQLLRPRDIILRHVSSVTSPPPPPPPPPALPPATCAPPTHLPSQSFQTPPTLSTCTQSTTVDAAAGRLLPRPAPPPSHLLSKPRSPPQGVPPLKSCDCSSDGGGGGEGGGGGSDRVMWWPYEEVHAGTNGFSSSLQVGEGGFGVVYRATVRNMDCAIKRLKQDCLLDWTLLKETFHTEVDKLSKFRHQNIIDLLGVSEGGGSVCLIYSFMENRSLEEQLHKQCGSLSWSHRLAVVEGVASALSFLHSPPDRHTLIHGDVKSSNILLDRHLVAKLADFGLARFARGGRSGHAVDQTTSVGKTETVRGTLAYLPEEYVRGGVLGPQVDVYSYGVVLLEVLTGRPPLVRDMKTGDRYLKDLVQEVTAGPAGSYEAAWRKKLDHQLLTGGAADPLGWMDVVTVACSCLDKRRKKRPSMSEVFKTLNQIQELEVRTSSSPSQPVARPPCSVDSRVDSLSSQFSSMGPLQDPDPGLLPTSSCSSLSVIGPCETDESRGFSQYDLRSPYRSNRTSSRSGSLSTRDQNLCPPLSRAGGGANGLSSSSLSSSSSSSSPQISIDVHVNEQQRLLDTMTPTVQLPWPDDLYGGQRSQSSRGPEESDELDFLPAEL